MDLSPAIEGCHGTGLPGRAGGGTCLILWENPAQGGKMVRSKGERDECWFM